MVPFSLLMGSFNQRYFCQWKIIEHNLITTNKNVFMIQVCLSVQEFATQLLSVLVWVELLAQLVPVASGSAVLLQVQIILSK